MDVKSAFLYGKIEGVYVGQRPGFDNPKFPDKVYRLEKANMVFVKHLEPGMALYPLICWNTTSREALQKRHHCQEGYLTSTNLCG